MLCRAQVFASGTGNRRHPLFFLSGPRRWLCRRLGISSAADGEEDADLAAVTAANPLPPSPGKLHTGSSEMQLPVRSPTPVAAAAGSGGSTSSSVSPLMGPTPSKAAAGMLNTIGLLPDSSKDSAAAVPGDAAGGEVAGGGFSEPEDVACERLRVEGLTDYEGHPIVVRALNKTYPGQDGQPPKVCGVSRDGGFERRHPASVRVLSLLRCGDTGPNMLLTPAPAAVVAAACSLLCAPLTWPLSVGSASACWVPMVPASQPAST